MIKITLAQINPTIGDIDGNLKLIVEAARQAERDGATLVVFPELALTGYYPGDLLDDPQFAHRILRGTEQLFDLSKDFPHQYWVVGLPTAVEHGTKDWRNSLMVIQDGHCVLVYHKQLLPTYGVFDERRHFEPGPDVARILRVDDVRVGFLICEDGWNLDGRQYPVNPLERLAEAAPDLVISINASPSSVGRREVRHDLFGHAARGYRMPILYVNQVGGHDQLVFDGGSFACDAIDGVVFELPQFKEAVRTIGFNPKGTFVDLNNNVMEALNNAAYKREEFYRQQIVLGLRDYARRCGFKSVVVGSSGGIDSALTLALAVEALGPENVVAVTMPSEYSSAGSVTDSEALCANLGIKLYTHPIRELVDQYKQGFLASTDVAIEGLSLENLQARIRGTILMEFSNRFGHLLLTTGNKSEISVGYCTLYGDTNGGLGVIGDLYKTEVFALARHLNATAERELIPASIIDKPPSAELAPGQKDTDSLPPYEVLDEILKVLIEGKLLSKSEYFVASRAVAEMEQTEEGKALIARVRKMIARNEYKRRQAPPILRVRPRAFGSGRQMPIAARYE